MLTTKTTEAAPLLVVIGAGGHAKVVIDSIVLSGTARIVGLTDADTTRRHVAGFSVLGSDDVLQRLRGEGVTKAFVALGDNRLRRKVMMRARAMGFELLNAIHPSAVISPSARLGGGVAVMAGVVINAETQVDDGAIINTGAVVDHDGRIGQASHIGPRCALAGNVSIGEEVFLGVGAVVVPGVTIGARTMVGAGACVVSDLPEAVVAVGVPAKVRRHV